MVISERPPAEPPAVLLFGIPFHDVTFAEAVAWAVARMKSGRPGYMATANLDFVMQAWRDPELHRILLEADLVIADGWPIVWASGKFGPKLRERVTGSDLTPMLATACAREHLGIFLLGGGPGVGEKAAAVLCDRNPGLRIVGCYSPPLAGVLEMDHGAILDRLRDTKPHLLLAALGAPKQEKLIGLHVRNWRVPLSIGVGGTLDFLAGVQRRAPAAVQRVGMEWLWRLCTNPKRLFSRYASNVTFLFSSLFRLLALQRKGRREGRHRAPQQDQRTNSLHAAELNAAVLSFPQLEATPDLERMTQHTVIDLAGRGTLDSRQLGLLHRAARQLRIRGKRLLLMHPSPALASFLRECRLDSYMEVCRDIDTARFALRDCDRAAAAGAISSVDGKLRVALPAELVAANIPAWANRVDAAWPVGICSAELDATRLEYLDSAGLGWLLGFRSCCTKHRIVCTCSGFSGRALQTLKMARLDILFAPDN